MRSQLPVLLAEKPAEFFSPVAADEVFLTVGGILVSASRVTEAHEILQESSVTMVRPPLVYYGNPLAFCDYRAEAEPYCEKFRASLMLHDQDAARPVVKYAFMHALTVRTQAAMRSAPLVRAMPLVAEAYEAMSRDFTYVTAMSKMATGILSKQHAWRLRSELHQAQNDAMIECAGHTFACDSLSACGTGSCRFAHGVFADITVPAAPGKILRPVNHVTGKMFAPDSGLADLEKLMPFSIVT